ncbi:ABC transporter ATP-binding protein [Kitasatospora sp. NRRL B-11411]|uniref:ABC transporter ATP-binding protein n=1 Tax=Kitasatospora sp. NRRL B-11411 TaxID=1463822 RepID=UPI00068CB95A|nr:ABC transporter ATP-binding protein [Kitasatospora sp. NRRL B-11411]
MSAEPTGRLHGAARALRLGWEASPRGLLLQFGLAVLSGAAPVAAAFLTKILVDRLIATGRSGPVDLAHLSLLAAAVAAAGAATTVLAQATAFSGVALGRAVNLLVHDRLYRRINDFRGLRPFEDPTVQDTVRLAEQSAQHAPRQVLDLLLTAARSTVTIASFLGLVLATWPPMGVLLLLTVALAAAGQLRAARHAADTTRTMMANARRQLSYRMLLTDRRAAMEIRLFGTGRLFHHKAMDAQRRAADADVLIARRNALVQSALGIAAAAASGLAAVVVVRQVADGRVTVGELTLFTGAVAAVQGALASLVAQFGRTEEALRLFGHYFDLLRLPSDLPDGGLHPGPLRRGITFENVWFRYGPDAPWALRGVDLHLPHGRAVGLVGANGAGKSTLVKLLCRFYDPERGRILWDGTDIRTLSVEELRRRIGATFQDYTMYDLSARDNIGVGAPERIEDLDGIRTAAARADIDGTLIALPKGYDTLLSRIFLDDDQEGGVLLSGGQWQRVALARSLLRADADLLVLDEPSSGLDPLAERRVHETLAHHRAGRTTLLISHRLSALRGADLIVVIDGGRVAEEGSHRELLARNGRYAELFTAQAEGYQHRPQEEHA